MTTPKRVPKANPNQPPTTKERILINNAANPLVFVSHDSRDAELAEAFSKLLSGISAGMLKSFRSSDKKGNQGIEFGVEWYPEVMSQIDSATDVVCLLTQRSLERPWILYEAGVAKGKMNTPVYGVALGISLSKAATGPFAQFQNCGDDPDSLSKLVKQLMGRIPGAEPDGDTVKMQVEVFKKKIDALLNSEKSAAPVRKPEGELADSSVAKLFEEVKVMFRELPMRLESRGDKSVRARMRRLQPDMLFELGEKLGGGKNDFVGLLVMVSLFKDEAPWIFELGIDAYRKLTVRSPSAREALQRLRSGCDLIAHHPGFRELSRNEDIYVAAMELRSFIEHLEVFGLRPSGFVRTKRQETEDAKK